MIMLVVGELFNFAAYAFAPAILVTPLGALSVLTGTVLGAYFLNERLSNLGKGGCALCIVGSIVIVANAPADKDIQTVDEILEYAVQPGKSPMTGNSKCSEVEIVTNYLPTRIPHLLLCYSSILGRHDLRRQPKIRDYKPSPLSLHLRCNGSSIRHGIESIRYCSEVDLCRLKSVHASFDVPFCFSSQRLYCYPDELLQQGAEHVSSISVSLLTQSHQNFQAS